MSPIKKPSSTLISLSELKSEDEQTKALTITALIDGRLRTTKVESKRLIEKISPLLSELSGLDEGSERSQEILSRIFKDRGEVGSIYGSDYSNFVKHSSTERGLFEMREDGLYYQWEPVAKEHLALFEAFFENASREDEEKSLYDSFSQFIAKVSRAESKQAKALSSWLLLRLEEEGGLSLLPNGNILGYKGLDSSLRSLHSGPGHVLLPNGEVFQTEHDNLPNQPGSKVFLNPSRIDKMSDNTCSSGLHVGTWHYASDFASSPSSVVAVEFNPADLQAVTTDNKVRVSAYEVLEVVSSPIMEKHILTESGKKESLEKAKVVNELREAFSKGSNSSGKAETKAPTTSKRSAESSQKTSTKATAPTDKVDTSKPALPVKTEKGYRINP